MNRIPAVLSLALLSGCIVTKTVVDDADAAQKSSAAQFARLKALEGTWISTGNKGAESETIESRWRVTAGGTAIEETLFAGTDHEMVSLFHRDGPYLMLTHYCSVGNQPRMRAVHTQPPVGAEGYANIGFEYLDATNLNSPGDMHMGELLIELQPGGRMYETWTGYLNGKPAPSHVAKFKFERKQ